MGSATQTPMSKKKEKQKLVPVLISSREGMHAVVTNLVADKLAVAALKVEIEQKKAAIDQKYQEKLDDLNRQILSGEAGLEVWSQKYPQEFGDRRSIELTAATFGFRKGGPKVGKISGITWEKIVARLASIVIKENEGTPEERVVFDGEDYLRYPDAVVDKEALLADRKNIPAQALELAGILIEQDEFFFFEPKSEVVEASVKEAA